MGMILVLILGAYIFLSAFTILLVKKFITKNRWTIGTLTAMAILIPTYDIIITNILGAHYCYKDPNPKTYISKKIEYPLSIYWEDNIYPGFDKEDRKLMITNYLDGKHLKTMALNGDDGKVYVYTLNQPAWDQTKKEFDSKKYKNIYEQYAQTIIETSEQTYDKQSMPNMNYTVTFNEVELNPLARKFLYSDETKIIDNSTNETIAYNNRYMRFFYNILPDFAGGRYYVQEPVCGESYSYGFPRSKVFTSLKMKFIVKDINEYLYNKYIKGEK